MKKLVYLLTIIVSTFVNTVYSQGLQQAQYLPKEEQKTKLVFETSVGRLLFRKFTNGDDIEDFNKLKIDIQFNLGFERKLENNVGLGLHLFANSAQRVGVRLRISHYNNSRKIFDVGFGLALNEIETFPLDLEINYHITNDLAIYSRIDMTKFDFDKTHKVNSTNYGINLGLKITDPRSAAITGGVTLLGTLVFFISYAIENFN